MSEALLLLLAFTGGLLLGVFFYGGLWWTVRKGLVSPRPALWFLASYLLRTGIAMAGFYILSGGRWQRLLICLIGFLAARFFAVRLSKTAGPGNLGREAGHAA
ncbi:MAG: ATPase F0F1 [Desulfobulbaceae bacterium BRH_c16a]|nr:MAG: ATPase F0F1 [Desulfobulbaceae bacterium BRH_c16a]